MFGPLADGPVSAFKRLAAGGDFCVALPLRPLPCAKLMAIVFGDHCSSLSK